MSFIFQPTEDSALIKAIVTHESIWPYVTDDFSGKPEEYDPFLQNRLYILVLDPSGEDDVQPGELIGMWIFDQMSPVCYKTHTCILPLGRGLRAARAAREMAVWIWEHTKCDRLITDVPEDNRVALHFALGAGMTIYGRNPACYQKGGKLLDIIELGMSRPKPELVSVPLTNESAQTGNGRNGLTIPSESLPVHRVD